MGLFLFILKKMKDTSIIQSRIILCQRLAAIANSYNYTQDEIAAASGLSRGTINRIFKGKFAPTLDTFLKICQAIDANVIVEDGCSD